MIGIGALILKGEAGGAQEQVESHHGYLDQAGIYIGMNIYIYSLGTMSVFAVA